MFSKNEECDTGLPRLNAEEKASLEARLALPLRPGTGKMGRPIMLTANYFEVTQLPTGEIVQYNVEVEPDVPRVMRRRLFTDLEEKYRQSEFGGRLVAYDGMSNVYSMGVLPKENYVLRIEKAGRRPDDVRLFQFRLRRVSSVNLATLHQFLDGKLAHTPFDIITSLEVVLRHPLCKASVIVGRSMYDGKTVESISGAIDVWRGYFMSLRPSLSRLLLNIDSVSTAFIGADTVIAIARDFLKIPKGAPFEKVEIRDRSSLERFLGMTRIEQTHRPESKRRFKVLGLSPKPAAETIFEIDEGLPTARKLSVVQYFEEKYNIKLKHPLLPCLAVGSSQRAIFLPMEVCRIPPGQRYMRKLDGQQTADMIKIANRSPQDRLKHIQGGHSMISSVATPILDAFNIKIGANLVQIKGRILDPPTVFYSQKSRESSIRPSMGAWNLRDKSLEIGATAFSWAVLVFGRVSETEVQAFVRELVMTCSDTGMTFAQRQPPIIFARHQVSVESNVRESFAAGEKASGGKPTQFILCILPDDGAQLYGEIKFTTDTLIGRPSQCMLMKHIRRPNKQYCANLCMKINVKLGGVNSSLGKQVSFVVERPTMFLGADVTHPGVGDSTDKPSIAALVASMDIKLSRYAASVRVQGSRVEIISDMKEMFKEQLAYFVAANRVKPHRILFYRDGVSEGQFAQVLEFELKAIKDACREVDPSYSPTVTFILVQKRHHTRLFVSKLSDADRSGNIPAGTVVDSGCVHPNQFDFFLCSHGGLQGTSRPSHYHVVHDEHNFSADDLQNLSYQLCYTFARCTRSVSVVTPVYYAHLVAFRARFHFSGPTGFNKVKPELAPHMYFL